MPAILGLIPARGGSKGLAGKNLRPLLGVPLIGRTILSAIESGVLDRIVVTTDDPAIADCARAFGAEAPFLRPRRLAGDRAPVIDAALHALDTLAAAGYRPDSVMLLQPTSPLRGAQSIVRAAALHRRSRDAVVSVTPSGEHPHLAQRVKGGILAGFLPQRGAMHRQQLPPAYALNGAIYLVAAAELRRRRTFTPPNARALIMPREESVDVDTLEDFLEAERVLARGRPAPAARCFITAEAGVNHNGSLDRARRLADAARRAGADAIKFQTFSAEALATARAPLAAYQKKAAGGSSQAAMLRRLELSPAAHRTLAAHCRRIGLEFMSTPFDATSVVLLEDLRVKRHKIPSGEITNRPLVEVIARTGKPLILSTGMSTLAEVARALGWIRAVSKAPVTVLHCVTEYPAPANQSNLRAMDSLRAAFGLPVGWSDHTTGVDIATAAVARGAVLVEKHVTLDRRLPGPDHKASLEPREFKAMVDAIRRVESALGDGIKRPAPCERKNLSVARRSLVAGRPLARGTVLRASDLAAKRPAGGIEPASIDLVLGRVLRRPLALDEALSWSVLK